MVLANRKTLIAQLIALTIASLLGPLTFRNLQADGQARSQNTSEVLRLRTAGLPTPLVIAEDPRKRPITSLEIQGELRGEGDGRGTIALDESKLVFNEFGDATTVRAKAAGSSQVVFRQVKQGEKSEKRRLYEIVFTDGSFPKRMYLVLSAGATGPHRLLIRASNGRIQNREMFPAHILNLQGLPDINEPLPDTPLRYPFDLTTLSSAHGRSDGRLRRLAVRGSPNDAVHLDLDPNYLFFDVFGEVESTTLVGYEPIKATLNRVDIPDPAKNGRLLFEVKMDATDKKTNYFLVLSPTESGAHRLLIKEGGVLRHVLPLHSAARRYHLTMQAQLAETSVSEQQSIGDLRHAIGYCFRFKVESGAIVELHVQSRDDADHIDTALKHLKNLRRLSFNGSRLNAVGLPSLRNLAKLEQLYFSGAHIDDAGLASVKHLTQLRGLWFYDCQGITDKGIVHFGGLKNLKYLRLYREDSLIKSEPKAVVVTDTGLAHLKSLTELENLNLMGQKVTEVGLEHLKDLTSLNELDLSGDGITDAGLEHLYGLVRLKRLNLYQTRVTAAGKEALMSKLPMLRISH